MPSTKKVGAPATTRTVARGPDGSSYLNCDSCGKSIAAALIEVHDKECAKGGSSDALKVSITMEEKPVISPAEKRKKPAAAAAAGGEGEKKESPKKRGRKAGGGAGGSGEGGADAAAEGGGEDKAKRPVSGYMRYSKEILATEKEGALKGLSHKESISKIAEMWKALPDDEKAPYNEAYQKDKEAYDAANPKAPKAAKAKKEPAPKQAKKEAGARKGPSLTGYTLFSREKRAEAKESHPDAAPKEMMSILAGMWKELSDDVKAEWNQKAKDEVAAKEAKAAAEGGDVAMKDKEEDEEEADKKDEEEGDKKDEEKEEEEAAAAAEDGDDDE